MASMNNWLGFSLSPQEGQNNINTQTDDASYDSTTVAQQIQNPIIPNHASYSILDTNSHQDWTMKGPSDLSMLVGSTSGNGMEVEEQPKLEDFLSGTTTNGYIYSNYTTTCPNPNPNPNPNHATNNSNSTIGLSMIKSWLRNQPAPPVQPQEVDQSCADVVTGTIASGSQGLSLSMSTNETGSPMPLVPVTGESSSSENNNNKQKGACVNGNNNGGLDAQSGAIEAVPRKSIDTFGQRTSIYRGVTRHRWTGRYEAHLWDNSCRREGQTRKGRQVYLGGYDKEDKAARAYDLAALKYWGTTTTTNFPIGNYEKELEEMKNMTRQEYVASLRRKSSGFSRGASMYRGVTRHHQHGRWQARIGRVAGNKDLYLGTFSTQEEAAEAYDIAAIKFRGLNAVTNFDMSRYDVKSILESSTLPIGGAAKRLKDVSEHTETSIDGRRSDHENLTSHLTDNNISNYGNSHHANWPTIAFNQPQPLGMHYYGQSRAWCKQEHDSAVIGAAQGLQELQQLQLGGGTHNFFNGMHGMIGMDHSDHSTASNSVMYNGDYNVYNVMPIGTVMVDQGQNSNQINSYNGENEPMVGASDPYASSRNMYYLSQQQSSSSVNEQGNGYNNWIQNSVQAMAPRTNNNVTVCHGAPPLFTVWNDA